jgi:predicted PurR-regulated permease PerM
VDNLVKPYIISRGSKLPFIVMFIGVLGGVATFGFIGIFLGPTLLAVGFSLAHEILGQRRRNSTPIPLRNPGNNEPSEAGDMERQADGTPSARSES